MVTKIMLDAYKIFVLILVTNKFNIIYTILFMFIFWRVLYLSHWTIIIVSKLVPILSHLFMLGVYFLLRTNYNRVRGVMKDHVWNTDLVLSYPVFHHSLTSPFVNL